MRPFSCIFRVVVFLVALSSAAVFSQAAVAQDATAQETPAAESSSGVTGIKPGINDRFKDPTLDVSEWIGRFEIESREVYASRDEVIKACQIKAGDRVADVGAGTGFFSRLFADSVGTDGWVFSVDIAAPFLKHINEKSSESKVENLTCVLGTDTSIRLPADSVDLVFICDTYHHFEFPQASLASIHRAIRPGGQLVLIDFNRIPGKSRDFILGHVRAGKEVFRQEVIDSGFQFVEEIKIGGFKENYFLRFKKPE